MPRDALQELGYAIRQLRRRPAFTSAAVLTLALGVAVNASVFAIARSVVATLVPQRTYDEVSVLKITEPRRQVSTFYSMTQGTLRRVEQDLPPHVAGIGAVGFQEPATVTAPGCAEILNVQPVSGGYAGVFDLRPQAGRWLDSGDDRDAAPNKVAVLSDRVWRDWFRADPAVAGDAVIRINLVPFTVVGVAAPGFRGITPGFDRPDVWIPEATLAELYPLRPHGSARPVTVFVVRQAGASVAELRDRLRPFITAGPWDQLVPPGLSVVPISELNEPYTRGRLFAAGLATLVLLAACANFANMLFARGTERASELAMRRALGASTARIFRLLLTESVLIGLLAALVGLGLAVGATSVFAAAYPSLLVDRTNLVTLTIVPDVWLAVYSFASGAVAAIEAGSLTAIRVVRLPTLRVLASGGVPAGITSRGRLRATLVAVQVTTALVLVMGAGLFLENQPDRLDLDKRIRYDASRLTAARMDLSFNGYTEARGQAVFERMLDAAKNIPGVNRAALADGIPGAVGDAAPPTTPLIAEVSKERPGNPRRVRGTTVAISPSLLATLGVPVLRGRLFTQWDAAGAPLVAIVSTSMGEALYPGRDALGKSVELGFGGPWLTIVGVRADPITGDTSAGVFDRPSNVVFVPALQHYKAKMFILVQSSRPQAVVEPLRGAMRSIDDRVPMYRPATLEDRFVTWAAPARAARVLMVTVGATALIIAMLGIFGVVNYFVNVRTREFGIRVALGATKAGVMRLVIDQAVHVLLVGLLFGVTVTTMASRVIEQRLTHTMPNQIVTWAIAPLLLLGAGLLSAYFPARRAARVDPNVALRHL